MANYPSQKGIIFTSFLLGQLIFKLIGAVYRHVCVPKSYLAQIGINNRVFHMVRDHPEVLEDGEWGHSELLALVGDVMADGIKSRGAEPAVMADIKKI
jgi:hypothetical protein